MSACLVVNAKHVNRKFFENSLKLLQIFCRHATAKTSEEQEIIIPSKIERSPTDILKALSATVGRDPTAAHYKYHDDPYFIPASNVSKRSYALSKESGRKAAHWVSNQHPDIFEAIRHDDPPVPAYIAFNPENLVYNEPSEEAVLERLNYNKPQLAYEMFQKCMNEGIKVSMDTSNRLLELLCYYNSADPPSTEFIEEAWYKKAKAKGVQKTWKDDGPAQKVFQSLGDERNVDSYRFLVRGMCKYYQVKNAYQTFLEMKEKGFKGDLLTYNFVLRIVNYLRDGNEEKLQLLEELFKMMVEDGVNPDLATFNAALELLSKFGMWKLARSYSLRLLAEMKQLGLEPSLGSYHLLMQVWCRDRTPTSGILSDIMDEIENKQFVIRHPSDVNFFVSAMDVCHNHLQDLQLAYRVNRLLQHGENHLLIGDSFKESVYYAHFFRLMCIAETIEDFLKVYDDLVPNVYCPEPTVMLDVVRALDANNALHHLPKIWSDIILFDMSRRENLLTEILQIMARESQSDPEIRERFAVIAWDIKERLDSAMSDRMVRNPVQWTGEMVGNVLITCLRADQGDKAWKMLEKLDTQQNQILGYPSESVMEELLASCVEQENIKKALKCISVSVEIGYAGTISFAQRVMNELPLSDAQREQLQDIIGEDLLMNNAS